jgi:predicted small lipoprotein YifL
MLCLLGCGHLGPLYLHSTRSTHPVESEGRSYLQRRQTRASGHTHHPYVEAATLYCRHESNTAMVSSLQPYLQCMLSTVSLSVFWLDTVLCGNLSKQARFL